MAGITLWELQEHGEWLETMADDELLEALAEYPCIRKYISTFMQDADERIDEEIVDALWGTDLLEGIVLYDGNLYDANRVVVPELKL